MRAGYSSQSMAGLFNSQALVTFTILLTLHLFVTSIKFGSTARALAAAFAYFYLSASRGTYVFISNLMAIYVIIMILSGRYEIPLGYVGGVTDCSSNSFGSCGWELFHTCVCLFAICTLWRWSIQKGQLTSGMTSVMSLSSGWKPLYFQCLLSAAILNEGHY